MKMSGVYELAKAEKFKHWLGTQGAVVQPPTNEFELIRFKTTNGTSVIYTGKRGLTFTGDAETAYERFTAGKSWKTVSRVRQALRQRKAALAARDGKRCFAHGQKMNFDQLTIEHLLAFSLGGSDNDANLCLVCDVCNEALGRMAVTQKIEWMIKRRREYMVALKEQQNDKL